MTVMSLPQSSTRARDNTEDRPAERAPSDSATFGSHDLWAPIPAQLGLFPDPAGPTQLALFGDAVPANEGEL